jgi:hypothetical protein
MLSSTSRAECSGFEIVPHRFRTPLWQDGDALRIDNLSLGEKSFSHKASCGAADLGARLKRRYVGAPELTASAGASS